MNMQFQGPTLKGSAEIRVIDSNTGEVKQVIKKDNVVCNWLYIGLLEGGNNFGNPNPHRNYLRGNFISIGNQSETPNMGRWYIDGIIATGFVASGVTSPTLTEDVSPPYYQVQNRISFIGSSRSFNTVCLTTSLPSSNAHASPINDVAVSAWLVLDVPCTQGPSDIIDIFYRIQFVDVDQHVRISPKAAIECYRAVAGFTAPNISYSDDNSRGAFLPGFLSFTPVTKNSTTFPYIDYYTETNQEAGFVANRGTAYTPPRGYTIGVKRALYKVKHTYTVNTTQEIGRVVNGITYGILDPAFNWTQASPILKSATAWSMENATPNTNVVQAKYSHSAAATLPMQDDQNLATGSGIFTVTGTTSTWTGKYPQIYNLDVVTGGNVGTATYRINVKHFLGQNGNTWADRITTNPFFHPDRAIRVKEHGMGSLKAIRFNESTIIQWDATGLNVVDIMTGAYIALDATTTPALPVTALNQVEVNPANGEIWAGCRATGLWKISLTGGLNPTFLAATVTRMTTDACYGVDVGRNGRVYAVLEGRLANSDDFSVALPITYAGLTDSNWACAVLLKVDPEHVDDRLGIALWDQSTNANTYNSNRRVVWWSQAAGATTGHFLYTSTVNTLNWINHNNFFNVSDSGSFWAIQLFNGSNHILAKMAWGTTQQDAFTILGNSTVYSAPYNQIFFEKNCLIGRTSIWDINGTKVAADHRAIDMGYRFVYMGKGIAHFGNYQFHIFNQSNMVNGTSGTTIRDNPLGWDYYEWNGSAWVIRPWVWSTITNTWLQEPAIGAKTTHTSTDAMPFGLTIAWATGTSSPHFVANNYYTQYVCRGIFKDVSNTLNHEFAFYAKPLKIDQAISVTVPNTAPYRVIVPKSMFGGSPDTRFVGLDNDQTYNHSLSLSGYGGNPLATLYGTFNSVPGPNEAIVNMSNGSFIFNAADAGKTLTGTYSYVTGIQEYPHATRTLFGTPGLLAGYESDVGTTVGAGNAVTAWADISGAGITATRPEASAPILTSGGPNGLPYLAFNGSKLLDLPGTHFRDFQRGFTFICVIRQGNVGTGLLFNLTTSYNNQGIVVIKNGANGATRYLMGFNGMAFDEASTGNTVQDSWNVIVVSHFPDMARYIRVNGVTTVTSNTTNDSILYNYRHMNRTRCHICGDGNGNPALAADIAALYVMDTALTLPEAAAIEQSLKSKYALTTY
jgi:hypothetical protein